MVGQGWVGRAGLTRRKEGRGGGGGEYDSERGNRDRGGVFGSNIYLSNSSNN